MTVYKPIHLLADKAAELALLLARKQPLPAASRTLNNEKKDVPAFLIDPVQVDKDNMAATVIKDGWQKLDAVYKDVPKDQWPK
jgi:D-xylose transport system substrate-binding protein